MKVRTLKNAQPNLCLLRELVPGQVFRLEHGTKPLMKVSNWTQLNGSPTPLRDRNAVYLGTGQAIYVSSKTPVVPLDATLVVRPERDLFSDLADLLS